MNWYAYIGIFFAMLAVDYVFAKYTAAVAEYLPIRAGLWAAAIPLFNYFVVVSFISTPWALVPICFGAFVGTFLAVRGKV